MSSRKPKTATPATDLPTTESAMLALLHERYNDNEWAFFPHLRNGTGYSRHTTRTADAFVMNLWPSRGLALHGFEIKVTRPDWQKELLNPGKADDMAKFANYWWVAASNEKIVQAGELPDGWGLLVPVVRAGKVSLRVFTEAQKKKAAPLDRTMVAAMARNICEGTIPKASIQDRLSRERERGIEVGIERGKGDGKRWESDATTLRKNIEEFERVSGIQINGWSYGRIEKAVAAVVAAADSGQLAERLQRDRQQYTSVLLKIDEAIEALRKKP